MHAHSWNLTAYHFFRLSTLHLDRFIAWIAVWNADFRLASTSRFVPFGSLLWDRLDLRLPSDVNGHIAELRLPLEWIPLWLLLNWHVLFGLIGVADSFLAALLRKVFLWPGFRLRLRNVGGMRRVVSWLSTCFLYFFCLTNWSEAVDFGALLRSIIDLFLLFRTIGFIMIVDVLLWLFPWVLVRYPLKMSGVDLPMGWLRSPILRLLFADYWLFLSLLFDLLLLALDILNYLSRHVNLAVLKH